ncbi:hypothetical protein KFU94_09060 [Chloroflexi bacterium TSY]|nr:hypothetical protein [Chloroflexi bacterium TSY]
MVEGVKMGEGNLQETKIFQGTEEEFVRAVKGFYPEAQGAYLRVSEANTVSVDLGWGLVSRHPLRFQHTGIIHARPLPDNKTGLSIRASEQNWPTINEKVWWPLLERLILDGWILPKGGNAEEHPADDLGIFDVEITELTDSVDPNLAFLAIFSRDCRDFGVIYSDFGYRKQPISYLKIAQI